MYDKILKISKKLNSKFFFNYDISRLTWFRAGGKTDIYCIISDENELEIILNNIGNIPFLVIGSGSNLLIRDGGFKGLIIKLGKSFNSLFIENNKINTGASILDFNLAKYAYLNSIRNLEFFSGIPGSLGGAIKMNAGCFGSETKDVLFSATVMKNNGKKIIVYNDQLELSYRNSNILNNDIVVSAAFNIELGDKKEIEKKLKVIKKKREYSQPIRTKTGGSSFKNPIGHHAAKLIDLAGCKGLMVGDVAVSSKHANFLINTNNATAGQIEDLGKMIIEKVYNKFGIKLDWEIMIVGDKN